MLSWRRQKDGVVIWSAIPASYVLQRVVAAVLNLPVAKIRVIAPDRAVGLAARLSKIRTAVRHAGP